MCPSVSPSVRPSVRRSISRSVTPSLRRLLGVSNAEYSTLLYGIPRQDLVNLRQRVQNHNANKNERVKDKIILISEQRLFKPVQIKNNKGKEFLHINFRDKRLDLINLSSILRKSHFQYTYIFYRKFPSIIDLRYSIFISCRSDHRYRGSKNPARVYRLALLPQLS